MIVPRKLVFGSVGLFAAAMVLGYLPGATAQEAEAVERGRLDFLRYYLPLRKGMDRLPRAEIVEMLSAVLGGSQMGPGEGWFHGSQSRYDWKWLARRFDSNRDGMILRAEFKGPSQHFDRLDRNHDGAIQSSDFDWGERSLYAMQSMPSSFWFRGMDGNSNGRISKEEWLGLFEKVARGKGYMTQDDLRESFPVAPPPRPIGVPPPPRGDGPNVLVLLQGLATGELGSFFEGPGVNQRAPDFTLSTHDGKKMIQMSKYRGNKPLVLVFGSFT